MIFTEQQLEKLSNPPPKYQTDQIIRTQQTIRDTLQKNIPSDHIKEQFKMESFEYSIYLQGSYRNSTNIAHSSDVDIVIELTSLFYYNTDLLTETQKQQRKKDSNPSKYNFSEFKNAVQSALVKEFGNTIVTRDNKCLWFKGHKNFVDADIIPCCTFRQYTFYESATNSKSNDGIEFKADSGEWIVNYPRQHYDKLAMKSGNTSGNFKESVRLFKNLRDQLIANKRIPKSCAKSYFIENMLYNIEDSYFKGTFTERFKAILGKLIVDFNNSTLDAYKCANGINSLFSDTNWNKQLCREYLTGLVFIKDSDAF